MKYNKIGIICAMEIEAEAIRARLENPETVKVASLRFEKGRIGGREVVIAVCGIGKVFAAICAQTMILHFAPDAIFNSGVAGSLSEKLDILDLAVSRDLVQHDMDTSPLGDPVGLISGINKVYLPADPILSEAVVRHAEALGIRTLTGTVASGDQFIAAKEQKERIRAAFSPIACEMEGAAVAQVAFVNAVPFCAIRAISDSFTGQNEMDYAAFAPAAAERGARLLIAILEDEACL